MEHDIQVLRFVVALAAATSAAASHVALRSISGTLLTMSERDS